MADDVTAAAPPTTGTKPLFGFDQINRPTPSSAKWIFGGYYMLSNAVLAWLGAMSANHLLSITPAILLIITLTINLLLNPIFYGVSKMFGIQPPADNTSTT